MEDTEFRESVAQSLATLATPPKDTAGDLEAAIEAAIAEKVGRIEKVTTAGRSNLFWYFGVLAYATLTLTGIRDSDLYTASAKTTLPIVNFDVGQLQFMLIAPLLIAVIHAYLHGVLDQLWTDLGKIPATDKSGKIAARMPVWLVIDLALALRRRLRWGAEEECTTVNLLSTAGIVATFLMVWVAPPVVVGWFWWKMLVLHDIWYSAAQALFLLMTILVSLLSGEAMARMMRLQQTETKSDTARNATRENVEAAKPSEQKGT